MTDCGPYHKLLEPQIRKGVQVGMLPEWTRVHGRVAYQVLQGPYEQLPGAWPKFIEAAFAKAGGAPAGPTGDVYACGPMEHPNDASKMLTILYFPVA